MESFLDDNSGSRPRPLKTSEKGTAHWSSQVQFHLTNLLLIFCEKNQLRNEKRKIKKVEMMK